MVVFLTMLIGAVDNVVCLTGFSGVVLAVGRLFLPELYHGGRVCFAIRPLATSV